MNRRPLDYAEGVSGGQLWAAFRASLLDRLSEAVPRERDWNTDKDLQKARG
jgi:hypothetical protein